MNNFMFLPIQKVDLIERKVYLTAASETKDKQNQVMDYAKSIPEFQKWSDTFAAVTMGKSYGNIRLQHRADSPIGKVADPLVFNDEAKSVEVCVKIVDENAWNLVKEGVLTGASIGGAYKERWYDAATRCQRYVPEIHEISLVDKPCNPDATFQLIKSDGSVEICKFTTTEKETDMSTESLNAILADVLNKAQDDPNLTKSLINVLKTELNKSSDSPTPPAGIGTVEEDTKTVTGAVTPEKDATVPKDIQPVKKEDAPAGGAEVEKVEKAVASSEDKTAEEEDILEEDPSADLENVSKVKKVEGKPNPFVDPKEVKKADPSKEVVPPEVVKKVEGKPPAEGSAKEEASESPKKEATEPPTEDVVPPKEVAKCDKEVAKCDNDNTLEKAGAKYSKVTLDALQKAHHAIMEAGGPEAACKCANCSNAYKTGLFKADNNGNELQQVDLKEVLSKVDGLEKVNTDLLTKVDGLEKANTDLLVKVTKLEAQPDTSNAPMAFKVDKANVAATDLKKSDNSNKPTFPQPVLNTQQEKLMSALTECRNNPVPMRM